MRNLTLSRSLVPRFRVALIGAFTSPPATVMHAPQHFGGRMQAAQPEGDAAIRQTDSDAALARWSAVQKGYFSDPFMKSLLPRGASHQPPRAPLINIGTYVRSEAIDKLVDEWFQLSAQEGKNCQIVSLGAGSDTRFWRIAVREVFARRTSNRKQLIARISGRLAPIQSDWRIMLKSTSQRTL